MRRRIAINPTSKIYAPRAQAKTKCSGRVTPRELMPLLVKREFNQHTSGRTFSSLREAANVCTYRNELNSLARNLTAHLPEEKKFVGGNEEGKYEGHFISAQEVLDQIILLYDVCNSFKTLPRRSMFHDWAVVFDGTPIYGCSVESFTLTPRSVENTQSVQHIRNFALGLVLVARNSS